EIFKGNKELFKACAIYQTDYTWPTYPVLSFDLANIQSASPEAFSIGLDTVITRMAAEQGILLEGPSIQFKLQVLIEELAKKYHQSVILVDEYDHPIVDNLDNPTVAEENRKTIKNFFTTFKSLNKYLRFVFITGISKFAQASISSGVNNLKNITMNPKYAAIMGYTEEELKTHFTEHLQLVAQQRGSTEEAIFTEVKEWYNGYRFSKAETYVYNPFSTLNYMDEQEPQSYWYTTGTPSFLIHEIQKRPAIATSLAPISASQNQLTDARTLEDIELSTLMFQTGYLTIRDWEYDTTLKTTIYHLNFPNEEVHQAFYQSLARDLGKTTPQVITQLAIKLQQEFTALDLASAIKTINIQFAKIPYDAFKDAKEGFYQAMLLLCLELSGLRTYGEVHTNLGRIDLVVQQPQHTFIFELKVDQPAAVALDQIHTKNYQERYLKDGKEIVAVAASFSTQTRNISVWKAGLYTAEGTLIRVLESAAD
ncbi:MAG: AAA family ATPase, partial [Bacteroidota bacterium]